LIIFFLIVSVMILRDLMFKRFAAPQGCKSLCLR
jgi:hypothetical protein